ncbi:MAG: leucine--tRNA ligase [Planctomycetes bacterium]|nr:leucine--tRNA ligase [Planctomycetota bacterium]
MPRYQPRQLEPKWQAYWEKHETFRTPDLPTGPKLYVLDMFPYPSGDGLHVGHPEGYTATDIVCRFERMRGKSVLHPMGFDAFGLPAEEHAIRTNTPPRVQTERNIANFRRQLKMLGLSYDWNRELATTDVDYFRWTQWIFTLLFDTWFDDEAGRGRPIAELPVPSEVAEQGEREIRKYQDQFRLAYQSDALVNWCPALGTVLANEEVIDGKSERGNHPVQRIPLRQWMLRITAYADRLERDLELVRWPDSTKKLQADWIGRSVGAEVDFFLGSPEQFSDWKSERSRRGFPAQPGADVLRIYTTRPDTLFGATYMVIAPEHPFVDRLTTAGQRAAITAYRERAATRSDRERTEASKAKTGVFTGSHAINPVNGQPIPIWIADYVLISYGTGAIMAVPAHDTRDFEFAVEFHLPIVAVVDPGSVGEVDRAKLLAGEQCYAGVGRAIHSNEFDGMETEPFKIRIAERLAAEGIGRRAVNYKLRDWLFSRQRFWGEPFPILHELDGAGQPTGMLRAVPPDQLPVDLPRLDDYKPHGRPEPPLAKAPDDWLYPVIDGQRYRRETNTMPQWAGSCWYYLRFIDPKNPQAPVDREKERVWMPVDLYVGGAEHAVLHLLYARFWHKVLYDRGFVSTPEPFARLVHQGMILGEIEFTGYQDASGNWISASDVAEDANGAPVMRIKTPTGGAATTPPTALQARKVDPEQVEKKGDLFVLRELPSIRIESRANKMSKSRGNVVNPDEIVRDFGADSLRLYEMFMGPLEQVKPWSMAGVSGVRGFLDRAWRMIVDEKLEAIALSPAIDDSLPSDAQNRVIHKTIQAVTRDLERMEFNTAIARMMEFVNFFTKESQRPRSAMEAFVLLLSPFAPHIAEELWQLLGHSQSLAHAPWPPFEEAYTRDTSIEVPVQICGKLRSKISVPADCSPDDLETAARADARIAELLAGKQIVKSIVVPGRLVNFVVK